MVDILIANETECEYFSGIPTGKTEDVGKALKVLKSKGVSQVIITMGSRGVIYNRGRRNSP